MMEKREKRKSEKRAGNNLRDGADDSSDSMNGNISSTNIKSADFYELVWFKNKTTFF